MKYATGYLSIVQEGRFRMAILDGSALLLTAANSMRLNDGDLHRFHASHQLVDVGYEGDADFENGVAKSIRPHSVH